MLEQMKTFVHCETISKTRKRNQITKCRVYKTGISHRLTRTKQKKPNQTIRGPDTLANHSSISTSHVGHLPIVHIALFRSPPSLTHNNRSVIVLTIVVVLLRLFHSLHFHTPRLLTLLIPRREFVLPTIPKILERKLLRAAKRLNTANAIERRLEELLKAGLRTDVVERALHGHAVGAHHGVAVDGEDGQFVVLPDEVGARHYEACTVKWEFRQDVADFRVVH